MEVRHRYTEPLSAGKANALLKDARRYLVGGVNSPVRAFRHIDTAPVILSFGHGAEVVDATGRRYVDFIMGWGPLILGHHNAAVDKAIKEAIDQGLTIGLTHKEEVELARLVVEMVPSVEQLRFTPSGTEACMSAIRLARGSTGRHKILIFDGCYHGHGDSVLAGASAGIPEVVADDVVKVAFNDVSAIENALEIHKEELACAIVEPVAANMGVVPPEPGFLVRLREFTRQLGILLIFDEVVTGFRLGLSGAQGMLGLEPDLTTFGKILGGGLPIGAIGGPRRLMQNLAPEGNVYHGGTFAGHPLSMSAGIATLTELQQEPYSELEERCVRLANGLSEAARSGGISVQINRIGSLLAVFFTGEPVRSYIDVAKSRRGQFADWAKELLAQGILIPPSPFEAWFVSTAHTDDQIDRTIVAAAKAFGRL